MLSIHGLNFIEIPTVLLPQSALKKVREILSYALQSLLYAVLWYLTHRFALYKLLQYVLNCLVFTLISHFLNLLINTFPHAYLTYCLVSSSSSYISSWSIPLSFQSLIVQRPPSDIQSAIIRGLGPPPKHHPSPDWFNLTS